MFLFTNFFSVLIPFWGMLGLWTKRIGYHNRVGSPQTPISMADQNTVGVLFLQCGLRLIPSSLLCSESPLIRSVKCLTSHLMIVRPDND